MENRPEIAFEDIGDGNSAELTRIYNYYVENSTATYGTEQVTEEAFLDYYRIRDSRTVQRAILADGVPVGFCLLRPWNAKKQAYDHTYEYTVYLKPEYCGRGIGRLAYEKMEQLTADRQIKAVIAGVCAENTASCRLFEALGFEKCGHLKRVGIKFGRWLDLYYFEKEYE